MPALSGGHAEHLWSQPGTPGALPMEDPYNYYPGRPASGMLFFWSFLWPHIKLLLLHAFFYLRDPDFLKDPAFQRALAPLAPSLPARLAGLFVP